MISIKNNDHAMSQPTVADDAAAGYSLGSSWFDHLNGQSFQCADTTTGAALWTAVGAGRPIPPGGYFGPGHVTYVDDYAPAADLLTLQPIVIPARMLVNEAMLRLKTAGSAGAEMHIGLYASRNGLPATRLVDFGAIPLDGTAPSSHGIPGCVGIYYGFPLDPGLVFVAANFKSVATMPVMGCVAGALINGMPSLSVPVLQKQGGVRYLASSGPYAATTPGGSLPLSITAFTDGLGIDAPALWLRRA